MAELFFRFIASRYERGSVMITSNLEFAEWTQVFGHEKLTAASLDRSTHRYHILLMNGESYRFKESNKRQSKEHRDSNYVSHDLTPGLIKNMALGRDMNKLNAIV
jgi:hypothetical protein